MTQFTNLHKNLEYSFKSNKMLVIHKWSRKCTKKRLLKMYWRWAMKSYLFSVSFIENYTNYRSRDTMMTKYLFYFYQMINAASV